MEKTFRDDLLLRKYEELCVKYIPCKNFKSLKKVKSPWMTQEIKSLIRRKLEFWHLNRNSKWTNLVLINEYRNLKIDVKKKVKIAVKTYELSLSEKLRRIRNSFTNT